MTEYDHIYDSMSYSQILKKQKHYLAKELNKIYDFLKEANNLEELYVRSALVKVPAYMNVKVNGEYYYFKDGKWYKDEMPF